MTLIRFYNTIILFFSFSIMVAQDPPANNSYQTATELTVYEGVCGTPTQGDLTHATNTNNSDYSSGCMDDYYGVWAYADVWYKSTVPSSGELSLKTDAVTGYEEAQYGHIVVAYTLSNSTLTEIGCNYSTSGSNLDDDLFSLIELTGRTAGEEIYFMFVNLYQIESDSGSTKYLGPFTICAWNPTTASIAEKPSFALHYSNPIGNRLRLESDTEIQTLRVFDLMGKEVLRKTPNQQKLMLNTYTLAPGAYLLRVETTEGQQTVKLIKK